VKPDTFVFYLDNVEVLRVPASPLAVQDPTYFMVNLATGGGWPVDLSRYGNIVDMYVDYIRVYH
jgi:beta-glucanase (GH16 family)